MLHIPVVQERIAVSLSTAISKKIGVEVTIGRVDLGFFNRLIIDDVKVPDQWGEQLLKASRLSAKLSLYDLANGRINISSIQMFGMCANIYKDFGTSNGKRAEMFNFQFIADSLKSKEKKEKTPLDLQINSLIIRNGELSFRQQKAHICNGRRLQPRDLELRDISAHLILSKLTNDSLAVKVKRMAVKEKSGLNITSLSVTANAGRHGAAVHDFILKLNGTDIRVPHLTASYQTDANGIIAATLRYDGSIEATSIAPSDFAFVLPSLRGTHSRLSMSTVFSGTSSSLRVKTFQASSSDGSLKLKADGSLSDIQGSRKWNANLQKLYITGSFAQTVCKTLGAKFPEKINAKTLFADLKGSAGGDRNDMSMRAALHSSAGNANIMLATHHKRLLAEIDTKRFDVAEVVSGCDVGNVAARLKVEGTSTSDMALSGHVGSIEYKNKVYNNINADIVAKGTLVSGKLSVDDPRGQIAIQGRADRSPQRPMLNMTASIRNLRPSQVGLLGNHPDLIASMDVKADISGHSLNDINGTMGLTGMTFAFSDETINPGDITITSHDHGRDHNLSLSSDFCQASLTGQFHYNSLLGSIKNIVAKHIQSLPGTTLKYTKRNDNNFKLSATVSDTRLLRKLTGADIVVDKPLTVNAVLNDNHEQVDLSMQLPSFSFNGSSYRNLSVMANTASDTLRTNISLRKLMDNGKTSSYSLAANAADNTLGAILKLNDNEEQPIRGTFNTQTRFFKSGTGTPVAHVDFRPSAISIGDTVWNVLPSTVEYSKNDLRVNNFRIEHGNQNLAIDGRATRSADDSLNVYLKDINISYILNLVNFHSVEFSGMATGTATVASLFAEQPKAYARLDMNDFKFEDGRMGTLHANVSLNNAQKQIDIAATAIDRCDENGPERRTIIEGFVSPQRSEINLGITAQRTRIEFMKSFCSSFMDNIEGEADGKVAVAGPLSNINLTGDLVVNGRMRITPLNTSYSLRNATVHCIPDAIMLQNDTIYDRNGNIGIVNGVLGHQHLTRLTYDIDIEAQHLLAYDTHSFDGNTFYGTAFMTGDCHINGRSGEVGINVNGTTEKGSILVYNVASPDAIGSQDFLKWTSHAEKRDTTGTVSLKGDTGSREIASDMKINFLINCTPDATVKLLMDNQSGDYITLNGHGVLKANYFNKGGFDLFGNYTVDTGHYRLTVQNFLKRDFVFRQGGTINFGGDPYAATLNLNAVYSLASVSLADLNIGRSFTSNNTRVDCIMNITGTPSSPRVDFSLDIPSISSDARQMVYSLINSEEEMNQQVLYLLAVGRFMSQGRNNAGIEDANQQSQASLAMQSILSGTIMQQVNEVLGNLTSKSNWNFGANISTGTEGFNNAEYEGLLSGSLLSGRLLVDGQFGYRDNANATTSFIGDFDLKYLLYPNGNLAINFYNKTNDRYFTRNSLNTQGIGLLMKKDFSSLSDLFGIKRHKGKKKANDNTQRPQGYVQKKRQSKNSPTEGTD